MTTEEMNRLIEKNMTSVFQFCCHLTGNRGEGEELCQDTFLKAMEIRQRAKCSEEGNEARNYFIGIAVNLWRNKRRKQKLRQWIAPVESGDEEAYLKIPDSTNVERHIVRTEAIETLKIQIRNLPDKQRVVIEMYYSVEMSMEEIAKTLHISKETVKSRIRLAKQKLRKSMEAQGYEAE